MFTFITILYVSPHLANYTSFYSLMYYQFFNVELKSYSWFDWGLLYPADIVEKYTNVMIRLKDLELTPEVTSFIATH